MSKLNYGEIEKNWQEYWKENQTNKTNDDFSKDKNLEKKKFYILDMFPYPSGEGLHVGHPKGYIATDVYSRLKKMQGYNVLHPMGWDAFGLPAEQFAIKNKINPNIATEKNVKRYKEQIEMLGLNYDWDREVNTTDPKFYKWTQWMWKQMYKDGLSYESFEPINWCPSCKTGLSNEDLDGNACERCGTIVEKKPLRQWTIRITDYADRLLTDLDKLNWEPHIKELQRNWIGKNNGVKYKLKIKNSDKFVETYSTHFEAFYADTFAVIAADHKDLPNLIKDISNKEEILMKAKEIQEIKNKAGFAEIEDHVGFFTGLYLEDPISDRELPLWISSYALSDYGTGIIKCSAHDTRDFAFAKKYNLKLIAVMYPKNSSEEEKKRIDNFEYCFNDFDNAVLEEPPTFKGRNPKEAHVDILDYLVKNNFAEKSTQYKLKDWVFARQRYWGEPFPIVFDENRKSFAVANKELPVILPNVENYEPTDNGESPLANIKDWVEVFGFINTDGEFESVRNYIRFEDRMKEDILSNKKTNTIRLDKKNFEKDCVVSFKDQSDNIFSFGKILNIESKKLKDLDFDDERNGTIYNSKEEQVIDFKKYYGEHVDENTEFHIISFELFKSEIKKFFRETNTMPQWAGSSWYYLRYIDPKNDQEFVNKELEKNWDPVDFYVGGAEHATRHLIYARFWHKFLFDKGFVSYDEPFNKLQTVGLIMAEDGKKMSKRYLNVVNPDDVVKEFGADAMRTYEMFMGPFEKAIAWNTKSIAGVSRFLERVYSLVEKVELEKEINDNKEIERVINETIKKVGEDIEGFKFNTAIAQMMICINSFEEETKKGNKISRKTFSDFIQILSPFAVHICEEIWQNVLGNNFSIHTSSWPTYNEAKIVKEEIEMSLQISGKFRGTFFVKNNIEDEELKQIVKDLDLYKKYILDESEIKKIIIVKNRLINIVI